MNPRPVCTLQISACLLDVLNQLVEKGNTVIVIEHNLDVIKTADWIIDLGPEGGDDGGKIVAEGSPEQLALNKDSYTGRHLKKELESWHNYMRKRTLPETAS